MVTMVIDAAAPGTPSSAAMVCMAVGRWAVRRWAVRRWQEQIARRFDPYRPERHYMRGPGPKSRALDGVSGRAGG